MSHAVIDVARSHGFRLWQGCLWRWAVLTGAAVFLSASLLAQDTSSPSRTDDSTVDSPSTPAPQPALSGDRIISILQQQPELLAAAKEAAANQLSVDPATIKDDTIYDQIRHDPNLRAQITQELSSRGYDVSSDMDVGPTAAVRGALKKSFRQGAEARPSEDEDLNEPAMLHRPSPYPTMPSLQDLYSQFPTSETKLKRFGSGVFRYGTGNADELPMDLPAGPDYVLGPGDGLVLNLWGSIAQRLNRTVDRQGQVALPEAGTITIAGETIAQAQEMIGKALGEQYQNIRVEISLARLHTVRIYVVGDVQRPGAYDISSLSTPMNALYAAGGPTSHGSLRTVRHYRGKELVREVDLYDFLLHGVRSDIDRLLPGDTILVPPVGPQVAVSGMVRRPAVYELKGEQGLNEVLDLAGGVLVSATLRDAGTWEKVLDARCDEVYQFAADMGGAGFVFTGENDAEIMHNSAMINLHMAHFGVAKKVKQVFYSSSACIYPAYNQQDPNNPNCAERTAYPAAPDSEYGWEKLFSERLYFSFCRNHGLNVRVARFHNIFGPEGAWVGGREKAPAALCRKIAEQPAGGEIELWGDGEQTRSFLYIDECIAAVRRLMQCATFRGPVNIGSDEMVTINQMAEMIMEIAGKMVTIKHIPGPQGVRGRNSDNALIRKQLGWAPSASLKDGLAKTYPWIEAKVKALSIRGHGNAQEIERAQSFAAR